jgi:hypothetical protein
MTTKIRCSDRAGRRKLSSPGRPGVAWREDRQLFWLAIAVGRSSEDPAPVGVSTPVGSRWFRPAGGMAPNSTPRKCFGFKTPIEAMLAELVNDVQMRFA